MAYTLTREEQETTIGWCAADNTAEVWTADPAVVRKLDKLTQEYPEVYKCVREADQFGEKHFTMDARYVRFGKPASEAQREANRRNSTFC